MPKADQPQDWTEPGAHEVTPGVFRIPLPLPNDALRAVNVYAVRDGDQLVMIDGGWALEESEAKLASSLEGIGHGLGDISQFLVTHVHRDHYTQAVAVRRRFGTRVSLGEGERASLEALKPKNAPFEMPQLALLRAAGADELVRALRGAPHEGRDSANWTGPDQWLPDGARISLDKRDLDAIRTPGHTQGHLVFHDASAHLLFSGDHVLPHITPSIGFEAAIVPSPLSDYLISLQLVRNLPDAIMLPAHGPPGSSIHTRVDELLDHHEDRLDSSLAAIGAGASTAYEVAARLGWTRRQRRLADLDDFNKMLAILEAAAHLEVLAERGRATRAEADGRVHYTLPGVAPPRIGPAVPASDEGCLAAMPSSSPTLISGLVPPSRPSLRPSRHI